MPAPFGGIWAGYEIKNSKNRGHIKQLIYKNLSTALIKKLSSITIYSVVIITKIAIKVQCPGRCGQMDITGDLIVPNHQSDLRNSLLAITLHTYQLRMLDYQVPCRNKLTILLREIAKNSNASRKSKRSE